MQQPLVTIITPAFNSANFLGECIESVQAQTFPHWEMLIVNDGSEDNTAQVVKRYSAKDPRIRYFSTGVNRGRPTYARNLALREAKTRYIAFLDSDDLWLPHKLERQVAFMQQKKIALSFTEYRRLSQDGRQVGRLISAPDTVTHDQLIKHNVIACLTAMVDQYKTGPLQMPDCWLDDFLLWLKITSMGFTAHCLKQDLARYRVGQQSISRNKVKAAMRTWQMYRQSLRMPLVQSAVTFLQYAYFSSLKHRTF